jgi:pimeloyl-ACP methyl ester carboxylesterase
VSLRSAQLASEANNRSVQREMVVAKTVTRYWRYAGNHMDAKTIVFVHGYRGNHRGLEAIAGALPDFDIIIPDLPGFGQSTPFDGKHSIESYSKWLGEFIEGLGLKHRPILLGHSFGTIVCANFAATGPDLEALVLVNPVSAPALKGPKALLTKLATSFLWLSGELPLKQGIWLLKSWPMVRGMSIVMTKSFDRKLRSWVHAQHDANFSDFANRRVALEGYQASISHHVGEYAAKFQVPTLIIIGSKDDITSPKQQREMAKTINCDWSLVEHQKVGHLTHYEIPEFVASDIRNQLEAWQDAR